MTPLRRTVLLVATAVLAACGGGSGPESTAIARDSPQADPIPVLPTSYENKNHPRITDTKLPGRDEVLDLEMESDERGLAVRGMAFADFARDGTAMAIVTSDAFNNRFPTSNKLSWPDSPGRVYLLKKDGSGRWRDVSSRFFRDGTPRRICISSSFIEIADFNNDGRPDAFPACTDIDFPVDGAWGDGGHEQYVVLSQHDGRYEVRPAGVGRLYGHQASAADINGDGNIDVLVSDGSKYPHPVVLWGKGDGTFEPDATRFPDDMRGKAIYTIRAIPIEGRLQVFVAGQAPSSVDGTFRDFEEFGIRLYEYDGSKFVLVRDLTPSIPLVEGTGLPYVLALDAIYRNGKLYTAQVGHMYEVDAIVETDLASATSRILFFHRVTANSLGGSFNLRLTTRQTLTMQGGNCGSHSSNPGYWMHVHCNFDIPLP